LGCGRSSYFSICPSSTSCPGKKYYHKPKTDKTEKKSEKPKPAPVKGLDDYLKEQKDKKKEFYDSLATKEIVVPVPKTIETESKSTKTRPKSAAPGPKVLETLETLFKFESTRSARDDEPEDTSPSENYEPRPSGRRGRGGRGRGGRYNNSNNNPPPAAPPAEEEAAPPPQYYDPSSISKEDEWPILV
jgi:hypothetical protein